MTDVGIFDDAKANRVYLWKEAKQVKRSDILDGCGELMELWLSEKCRWLPHRSVHMHLHDGLTRRGDRDGSSLVLWRQDY
jgi:hypothetical protein